MSTDGAARQTAGTRQRFRSLAEWGAVPKREVSFGGILARGEIALLTGAPKSGKSTVAASLAAAVSTGGAFLGRRCEQGAVLYIAAERATSVLRRLHAAGADPDAAFVAEWAPDILNQVPAIIAEIRAVKTSPALIVIDTLARCILGTEENSAREMGQVVAALAALQQAFSCAAFVVVHHTGKGNGSARGSSALLGGVDHELTVEARKAGGSVKLAHSNYAPPGEALDYKLRAVELDDGAEMIAVADAEPRPRRNAPAPLEARTQAQATAFREKIMLIDAALGPDDPTTKGVRKAAERLGFMDDVQLGSRDAKARRLRARLLEFRRKEGRDGGVLHEA